jgi:DNA ligase (NAD+)
MKLNVLAAALLAAVLALSTSAVAESPTLTPTEARVQISDLRRELARHDELYHRKAAPEISDADYDTLKRRLASLERAFPDAAVAVPSLAAIGDDRSGKFPTYRHRERMLSLEKAYSETEVRAFHARLAKSLGRDDLSFVIEPKFDGLAVSVTFANGKLVRAVTRGNGTEGEDITANVLKVQGLPRELRNTTEHALPELIELRGEVFVPFAEFQRVNAERDAAGLAAFANPRNLAAGTIRQLDVDEVARRGLQIVFYGFGACEPASAAPTTQLALHAAIAAWGLPGVAQTWTAHNADELVRAIDAVARARRDFAFPTDGAVMKLDSVALQREAGVSESAPRWALAYKFPPERAETKVLAITVQVGRTGVLTPVAELAPVALAGSNVTRATLHNRDEIARRDVRVGDFVYIEKAGEIIPAIVGVNLAKRSADAAAFAFPAACPECGTTVQQRETEVAVRCPNANCPAQLRRRIEHFASKACVNIEGLGPAMIELLVAKGWVKDLPDLYRLKREELATLNRQSEHSIDRLLAAIEKSKRAELWRVVYGLGLPNVGTVAAKELARRYGSLEAVAAAEPRCRALVDALIAAGVQPVAPVAASGPLAGKTFVLTGTLPSLTRAQATAKIEAAGGRIATSVSRNTHYVIAGTEAGAKLDQAKKLGVAILDEAALLRLLADE